MMSAEQFLSLLPLVALVTGAVVVMLAIAFKRDHGLTFRLTLLSFAGCLAAVLANGGAGPSELTPLLRIDRFALFFTGLIALTGLAMAILSRDYLAARTDQPEEFYLLLLTTTLGGCLLASSSHFASFFLGLETLSVSLFPLIAYARRDERALEAAMKYLVLSGVASGFLLFGMALVYSATGVLGFGAMAMTSFSLPVIGGIALIVVAVGFKLSLVPFHLWTADVYQGAPAPVTALLATVSKGSLFAVLLRYGIDGGLLRVPMLLNVLAAVSGASMLVGNLLALGQPNLKRLLAYSSIAHMGYLLLGLVAAERIGTSLAAETLGFYLAAYFVATVAAFGIVIVRSPADRETEWVDDYEGLFWARPWQAALLTVALLSLAGMPLTAGFIGKFYLFAVGGRAALWGLLALMVAGSGLGLYYYLRVIYRMGSTPAASRPPSGAPVTAGPRTVLGLLGLLLLGLGTMPDYLIDRLLPLGESLRQPPQTWSPAASPAEQKRRTTGTPDFYGKVPITGPSRFV